MPVDPIINRYRLPQVITPIDDDDIANKAYVDTFAPVVTVDQDLEIALGRIICTISIATIINLIADSEGASGNDDLLGVQSLGGSTFVQGTLLIIRAKDSARTITIKHDAGGNMEFQLAGSADFALDHTSDTIMFISAGSKWMELSRSANL